MKNIVITGGLGFIGLNIIKEFRAKHPETKIVVVNNKKIDLDVENLKIIDKSIENIVAGDIDFSSTDAIILLAGISQKDGMDYSAFEQLNIDANKNILDIANKQNSNARIIFASSQLVYGENSSGLESETNLDSSDKYAKSKLGCENLIQKSISSTSNLTYTIFRISNPFGVHIPVNQNYNYANQLLLNLYKGQTINIYNNGEEMKNFIPIRNVARIIEKTVNSTLFKNETVNLGHHHEISLNDFYSLAKEIFGRGEIKILPGDVSKRNFNTQKLYDSIPKSDMYDIKDEIENFKSVFDKNNATVDLSYFLN